MTQVTKHSDLNMSASKLYLDQVMVFWQKGGHSLKLGS